ncbi:MAG TPA: NAD(P)H-dependent oxidoreductase subunit E [Actinomycetota bacterium]
MSSDLHLGPAAPTDDERAAVDELLAAAIAPPAAGRTEGLDGRVARGGQATRELRTLLLPALHALQSRVGWISEGGLNHVCERLSVPPAEAYGVATFYAMFSVTERPPAVVHVCDDLACRVTGAEELCAGFETELGPEGQDVGGVTWHRSPCLGMCERAPAMLVQRSGRDAHDVALAGVTDVHEVIGQDVATLTAAYGPSAPQTERPNAGLRLLRRVGVVDPTSIDDYVANGGYEALRRAVELGPEGVVREITDAKLLGRGGAAFPTGVKWKAVAEQVVHPHYVIANADESEPGTFKDRVLMERDPFGLVEALTIAGYATGAERGFLYIRGEYPLATERIQHAIAEARHHGYLGDDVRGDGFAFDLELRRGAGAYICGEETALFESIEGKRGEPRNKPPFPVTHGVFGKPTSINNVETLVNVLEILRVGGPAYAAIGTEGSTGPRLLCLSGHVADPGVYEVEHGITLRDVIDLAGGVRKGKELRAVLLGGAAGGFVGPDRLDVRLTFEDAREGGYTLGSGVVMLFDRDTDLADLCLRIARFFRDESCGQCVPCRVGTVRQEEALHRLAAGVPLGGREGELALLGDITQVMRDASICGLGQTAANAIQSAIATFDLFEGSTAR